MIIAGNKKTNNNPNSFAGYEIDNANSSPAVTRVNTTGWKVILSQIRAAVIKDDETVNYYLDPTDFDKKADGTASILTGADGQVMIYKPAYWRKCDTVGDIQTVKVSTVPLPGWEYKQAYWIGQVLGSVSGGKLQSIHGVMPTTDLNRSEFRTAARARGSNNWCIYPYEVWEFLNDFARFKYADRNSQGASMLGAGATNASSGDWSAYNGYNPVVACGLKKTLDDVEVAFSVANFVGGTGTLNSQAACFYGIEHIFGHIWHWCDGMNAHNSSALGARAFTCNNPTNFADDTETNYQLAGNLAEADGYISEMLNGGVLPSSVAGGSSATYYADYHYTYYNNDNNSGWRGMLVGGGLYNGAIAGLSCSSLYYAASYRSAAVGSRLCLRVK